MRCQTSVIATVAVALLAAAARSAAADSFAARIEPGPSEPPAFAVVPAYTLSALAVTPSKLAAGVPLELVVRRPAKNSNDTVVVTSASRTGDTIAVEIETRIATRCPYRANVVWQPIARVALGALPAGTYKLDIHEQVWTASGADPCDVKNAAPSERNTIADHVPVTIVAVDCRPQRAQLLPFTRSACAFGAPKVVWDGAQCVAHDVGPSCYSCSGADCGDVFTSLDRCYETYRMCRH